MDPLCTSEHVNKRMADTGLATASSDAAVNTEVIERKIEQVHRDGGELHVALLNKIANAIAPYDSYNDMEPMEIAETLSDASISLLQSTAEVYTISAMLEEGEARMRFKYEDAGKTIAELQKTWRAKAQKELDDIWKFLKFDLNGDGILTTLEKAITQGHFSSVRLTA